MVNLRSTIDADQRRIRQLIREGKINPFGIRWHNFVVAVDDTGRLVGCAQRKPHRGNVFELASVAVTHEMQGQGVARQLIEQIQQIHHRKTPFSPLWLMCASELEALYTKFGFVAVHNRREMVEYFGRMHLIANAFSQAPRLSVMVWRNG